MHVTDWRENLNKEDDMEDKDVNGYIIKIYLKEIGWEDMDRIYLPMDRDE
jgi:hypothetical protein